MSLKSDEFEQINYSFISSEKNEKEEVKVKEINKEKTDINKKHNLTKCFSSLGIKMKKKYNINTFPEINMNKKSKININKKKNLTSHSLYNLKNDSFGNEGYRTYNFPNILISSDNNNRKNIKYQKESKNENQEYMLTENNNKIKSISNKNGFQTIKPKTDIIKMLYTENNITKNEESDKDLFQDSQRIKKEYYNLQNEYLKKKKSINSLKEEEKISKEEELEMKNKILSEQIQKINFLYFDVLQKLIGYEESIKNIHKLKETKVKNEYILIELEYKYNHLLVEMDRNCKKIEELKNILNKKNSQLKQCQNNLDYYIQLNQKLLLDAENIYMSPKILALKNDYESKINENKKNLAFYKEENYKKDKILLELNCGNKNIDELYNNLTNNNISKEKCCFFKNAQKISKDYFKKNKENKDNKEIIALKNKINTLQEKIDKMNIKIKEYESNERCLKRYNSHNSKKTKKIKLNNNNLNIIKNYIKSNPIQFTIKNKFPYVIKIQEDIDGDFMSNLNMKEFLYILKKCFEAQYINHEDIKKKILNTEVFNLLKLNNKSDYNSFIIKVSENLCQLLKATKIQDKNDILSFVKTFLFNNLVENGNNIDEFQKQFLDSFKDITTYDKNSEEKYIKKLAKFFKDKIDNIKNEFEFIDFNKKGKISFIALKKVIERLKINIKNDILEYMIFFMKKASINDVNNINNYSLRDLNYKIFLEKLTSLIKSNNDLELSSNSNISEIENNNFEGAFNGNIGDDGSLIEITNEEYNEKLALIMNLISSEIMKKSNKNIEEYINKLFNKYITKDEIGHQIIELSKLIEEIKNSLFIELNQVEIFCLYSRFQINENNKNNNTESIDFKSFKNEILLYTNKTLNTKNTNNQLININNNNEEENNNNDEDNFMKEINNLSENDFETNDKKEGINEQNEEYNDFEKKNFDEVI